MGRVSTFSKTDLIPFLLMFLLNWNFSSYAQYFVNIGQILARKCFPVIKVSF